MSFLHKLGIGIGTGTGREVSRPIPQSGRTGNVAAAPAVGSPRPPEAPGSSRVSNGLKEFLWNLDGLGRGTLLDLGPAWQTTLNFFIERGFRVSSEDILREWADFYAQDEARIGAQKTPENYEERLPEARAKRFLEQNLVYAAGSFDALLLWDVLDYVDATLAKNMVAQLTELLRPGGVVFAMFHSKKPEGFQRYRVADTSTLQVLSAKPLLPAQKIYQNREIQELFGRYRSMKSYVARD